MWEAMQLANLKKKKREKDITMMWMLIASLKPSIDCWFFFCEAGLIIVSYLIQRLLNCHYKDKNYKGENLA